MLNIVIPMAGRGKRFAMAGHAEPKPLIPVFGRPMVELVVENLRPAAEHRFIFICQRAHDADGRLSALLGRTAPGCTILFIDAVTEGAACTVLLAEPLVGGDAPLVVANCDQYVDTDIDAFLRHASHPDLGGLIMTMPADHPKWSYARRNAAGWVEEVREKAVISSEATVGIYHFQHGSDFVRGARAMIGKNERVNNEFYVAPVYNELIAQGARIGTYDIGACMHGLGTPEDLAQFLVEFPAQRLAGR